MANTLSAAKNARKAVRKHALRISVKSELKTIRKTALTLASSEKTAKEAPAIALIAVRKYARAASNGYIHYRTASRKIGRLMKAMHKASLVKTA